MITEIRIAKPIDGSSGGTPIRAKFTPASSNDPFVLNFVDGLGPLKSNINTLKYSTTPGGSYVGSTYDIRNVVIEVGYNEEYVYSNELEPSDVRDLLYTYVTTGEPVRLYVYQNHQLKYFLDGYVESVVPVIFSKEPLIQISLICPEYPFLQNPFYTKVSDIPGTSGLSTLNVGGSIATGIRVTLRATTGYLDHVRFFITPRDHPLNTASRTVNIRGLYIEPGEEVYMNFRGGRVTLLQYKDNSTVNLLGRARLTGSEWPFLYPGSNAIRMDAWRNGTIRPERFVWEYQYAEQYIGI